MRKRVAPPPPVATSPSLPTRGRRIKQSGLPDFLSGANALGVKARALRAAAAAAARAKAKAKPKAKEKEKETGKDKGKGKGKAKDGKSTAKASKGLEAKGGKVVKKKIAFARLIATQALKRHSKAEQRRKEIAASIRAAERFKTLRPKKTLENTNKKKDSEERKLEDLVFGGIDLISGAHGTALAKALENDISESQKTKIESEEEASSKSEAPEDIFMIDRTARVVAFDEDEAGDDEESGDVSAPPLPQAQQPKSKPPQLVPLWTDDSIDDIDVDIATGAARLRKLRAYPSEKKVAGSEYELRLRRQFEKLHPTPAWAHLSEDTDSASVVGRETSLLLRSTRAMIDKSLGSGRRLLSSSILMHRAKDANFTAPSTALLESCKFHPSVPVMLTAGGDRTLRLFGIDGRRNEKIQSVFFRDLPIFSADFTIDGRQVVVAGRRKFFFVYDIQAGAVNKIPGIRGRDEKSFEKFKMSPCGRFIAFLGRDGYIVLVSRDSMQWIANLKMNGSIRAMDFTKDGRFLYSIGSDGEVYQWDLGARSCVHRFVDEGAIHSTTIAVSPDSSFIATGSNSGIVNVYASSTALYSSNPSPAKCLDSLTTSIAHLAFHPSSQALVFSSRLKKDALRIAHLPSLNVFPNWPTSSTPLSYVHSLDWSPGGGFLAIGNEKGRALLYRAAEFDAC